jgi:hypothetical protein
MQPNSVAPNTAGYAQSGILAASDFVRPDFQTKLFNQYGDQFAKEFLLLKRMQATRAIRNAQGGFHFEEDRYDTYIEVKANASTTGSTLKFTIATSQIETVGSIRTCYLNVGDFIIDPVTFKRYEVTSKVDDGTDFTFNAKEINGQTATVPTAGKRYGIYTNAYGENTGQPDAKSSFWTKYSFKLQKLKTSALITGDAAVDKLYPETDELGNVVGNWGGVQRTQAEFRHLKQSMGQLILGKESTASGVTQTTGGMMDTFATRANSIDIQSGVDLDTMKDLIDALKPNAVPNNYMGWLTRNVNRPLQSALFEYTKNANIEAVRRHSAEMIFGAGEASEGLMATFDYQTLTLEGMTFNLRLFDVSYDPELFGLDHEFNQFCSTAYFMPSGKATDPTGVMRRNMELTYAENGDNGQSRMFKIWETGANAPTPTNDIDNRVTNYLTHFGLDFFAIKQCGYFYNAELS